MRFRLIDALCLGVIGVGGFWSTGSATPAEGPECPPQDFCWDSCPGLFSLFCSNRAPACGDQMAPQSYCAPNGGCEGGWTVHCVWAAPE